MTDKVEKTQPRVDEKAKVAKSRVLSGVVVSTKMKDTIVVVVTRYVKHPKYKKYLKRVKRYHVHDMGNSKEMGDKVQIKETKPISKLKRFKIVG